MMRNRIWMLLLVGLVAIAGGCTDEDDGPMNPQSGADIPASDLPFPDTPSQMAANFLAVYENRDIDEYRLMMDPAFETHLKAATVNEFPALGQTLDFTEENRIHARLFSGDELTDAQGGLLPAVQQVEFEVFRQLVDWGVSLPTDPIPNTLSALYEVVILVDRGQSFAAIRVEGQIRFYAEPAEGRVDGKPQTYFRMAGQLDLTSPGKGSEQTNWGSLKALYH